MDVWGGPPDLRGSIKKGAGLVETELLIILVFVGLFALLIRSFIGVKTSTPEVKAILKDPQHKWTDSVRAWGGEMHFDPENRRVALIPRSGKAKVVSFSDIRRWNVVPLMNSVQTAQLGYRFQVTTNDPKDPITSLDIRGLNASVPDFWAAKLTAYVEG